MAAIKLTDSGKTLGAVGGKASVLMDGGVRRGAELLFK